MNRTELTPDWGRIYDAVKAGAHTREDIQKRSELTKRAVDLGVTALMFKGVLTTSARGIEININVDEHG